MKVGLMSWESFKYEILMKSIKLNFLILLGIFSFSNLVTSQTWTDNSFDDFSKGTLSASGQNIYITQKGEIKTIRRYDLNQDGWIDLLFNNTHDQENYVDATLATFDSAGISRISNLPVQGSISAESADLNKDGYPDLVFCPNLSGIQHPRRFLTIYWGRKEGWSSTKSNGMLPVNDVKSVRIADLNNDSWPDILTLNSTAWLPGQPDGQILRIYWGGENSYHLDQYSDIGLSGAQQIVAGDFNGDGLTDISYFNKIGEIHWIDGKELKNAQLQLYPKILSPDINQLASPEGVPLDMVVREKNGKTELYVLTDQDEILNLFYTTGGVWKQTVVAIGIIGTGISIGDVDNDGQEDILVTDFTIKMAAGGEMVGGDESGNDGFTILWGENGTYFSERIKIGIPNAISAQVGDLNGDGISDIAVAVYQGEETYLAQSQILFGRGNRLLENSGIDIPTQGTYDVCIVNNPGKENVTVVFSNSMGGVLYENVPLYLYFGGESGFIEENRVEIPFTSGYEATAADVNDDGFVDVLAVNSMHGGGFDDPLGGINIFKGDRNGFDFTGQREVLREFNASTSNVADLNKDGYLDIIIGFFDQQDRTETELVIYYGGPTGYLKENRKAIPSPGRSSSPMVADFDNDGWLDIAVSSYSENKLRIFKGSENGFDEAQQEIIPMHSAIDLEVADLNADGFLDIIVCHYKDHVNGHYDAGLTILWGSEKGFENWNSQWLPSYTPLGPVVADFDNDGYLDIFAPAYHGDISRENLPMYLYWGGEDGFVADRKSTFIGDSGTDALAADFNKDGKLDLVIAQHTVHGSHAKARSKIYFNDGNRFESDQVRVQDLASPGVHWMWNKDMGNIFDRSWSEYYISRVFSWETSKTTLELNYVAKETMGAAVDLLYRSSKANENINEIEWSVYNSDKVSISADDRNLQYKIIFNSPNGDWYPDLKSVEVKIK